MKPRHLLFAISNFFAVLVLVALIAGPFYLAGNFAKIEKAEGIEGSRNIAGVKTQAPYVITSQADRFPNMTVSQNGNVTKILFTKIGPTQAFLGVLTLANPQDQARTYTLEVTSGQAKLFFGQDLENQITQTSVGAKASVPISLFSGSESSASSQTVEFRIISK